MFQKYFYDGAVIGRFGQVVNPKFKASTMAMTPKKAKANLRYRAAKELGLASPGGLSLPGRIKTGMDFAEEREQKQRMYTFRLEKEVQDLLRQGRIKDLTGILPVKAADLMKIHDGLTPIQALTMLIGSIVPEILADELNSWTWDGKTLALQRRAR